MGATVTKDWTVAEITAHYPAAAEVFAEWGIHCFGCGVGGVETLGEAGRLHGFSEDDLERLVEDLNDAIAETPEKPDVLHVTKAAALQIREIAKTERPGVYPERSRGTGADGFAGAAEVDGEVGLSVRADRDGSFFMEFRGAPAPGERAFFNEEADDVKVYASPLTLRRIGGATIDFREGRFKLEMAPTQA